MLAELPLLGLFGFDAVVIFANSVRPLLLERLERLTERVLAAGL